MINKLSIRSSDKRNYHDNWLSRRIEESKNYQNAVFDKGVNSQIIEKRIGKKITLKGGKEVIEFVSCSYLGLESDPRLGDAAIAAIKKYGVQFAAARTRIAPDLIYSLDVELSKIFKSPTTSFSTVGLTHLATLPILGAGALPSYPICNKGILWILDKKSHASIQIYRPLLEQFGIIKRISFSDEEALISSFQYSKKHSLTPITLSDSVGSMGGVIPIKLLFSLAEQFNGYVYLDDAHGTSIFGLNGSGYVLKELDGNFHPRLILCSSLSKAFGATGGCVSTRSLEDIKIIQRYSVPFAFGGPLSLPGVAAGIASAKIHQTSELHLLQEKLSKVIRVFDKDAPKNVINKHSSFPIRGIEIGSEKKCINISKKLLQNGFFTTCAMYPTVPKGESILRVALSVNHTTEQIESFNNCLSKTIS